MTDRLPHPYVELVARRAAEPGRGWFLDRYRELGGTNFAATYAGAGRRLGAAEFMPSAGERARLLALGMPVPEGWPLSAVGRAALLCRMCEVLAPEAQLEVVTHQFRTGDNAEREALLRSLCLLPEPERFLALAVDSCRSHVQSVFEAIACDNAYPARFFPEENFNQLVLKAFFTGVAVRRIQGLAERRTPELVRMALAYASERRAAGRSVPADLELVTSPVPGT